MFGSDDRLDPMLPPGKLFHVVDADASQAKVIEEVRSGRNLVVQGPPGTGKSQTITNIIAAAVKDGKRVLFVAEKMAALSVVHDRLVKVGLGDVCLELHSRSANKKTVLGELARTIAQAQAVPSMPGERAALLETRDKLNALADVLHKPIGETGETPFTLLGLQARFIGKGTPPPELDAECLTSMSRDQEQSILNIIEQYSVLIRAEGSGSGHPYEGTQNLDLQPVDLAQLAEKLRSGLMDGEAAAAELRFARAEKLWQAALERDPDLRSLSHEKRHDLVASFTRLERQNLKDNVTEILAGHLQQVPQGAMGEMKVIRGEIGKKRGHIALRRLFEKAGTAIQRIKPVLLMSPISIAQFLPPGVLNFDLLVIDEASQVRPEDALGAIARANQIVVVGDNKQLPPSSFFDRLLADDAENEDAEEGSENLLDGAARVADMESILTLCEARGLGGRMLKWHYRSRDPSLISVSNREFYENGLILPPSPLQEDPDYGLCFTKVNGAYDKGGKRDNRKEGEAIVAKVAQHARENRTLSLGIATFSFAQRNLITELLELNRRSDPVLDEFLREGQSEDVFVKNIENVQGDERDVILVSVGYGPTTAGGRLTSMSFGPVNGEGGERRLNVLFTRARVRCEVFCSFDPGDMDVSRTSGEGPRILKRFLEFAKYGRIDDSAATGRDADSPFEEDVADVVKSFGFLVDPQVGSAGFRIDMGIRHPDKPGTYLLALECDGATYHSALWARERDRLRQDVLEHLGWRFHRIWSTDWFYNRQAEIERLRQALLSAQNHAVDGVKIDGANKARPTAPAPAEQAPVAVELPEVAARQMPAYTRADFRINAACEPHEAPLGTLAELATKIVYAEGPIHFEEAARRLASAFGKEKAGKRIVAATQMALSKAQTADSVLRCDGDFWFTTEQAESPPVRDRSNEEGATLKASNISMLEIKAALRIANEDNAGGETADLVRAAARLLGFRRVGGDLQARLAAGLETT